MTTPDTPIEALMQRWAITRNAVKKRARELGVELLRPDRFTCLWPGEALDLGEQLHEHLQAGRPIRTFPGLPLATEAKPVAASGATPGAPLAHRSAAATALVSAQVHLAAIEAAQVQMAALVSALRRPPDPLASAEALIRAADLGVSLNSAEIGDALGFAASTVREWKDGHVPRPGFILRRQQEQEKGSVWWIVERAGSGKAGRKGDRHR